MPKRFVGCAAAVLGLALVTPSLCAQDKPSSIDQLAPENSVFIIGASNFGASMERLKSTRLWDFWQSEDGRTLREKFEEAKKEALEEMSTDLDMEMDEIPMPTGAAGFAYFTVEDDESGAMKPGVLLYADYGENAEKVFELVQKMLDQGEESDEVTFETINRVDREGWRIEFPEAEAGAAVGADGEEDWMNEAPTGPPFEAIEIIKDGTMLMICSDQEALEQALTARDGEDIQSIADREDHKAIRQQLGEGEIYGALLMRDFWEAIGALQGGDAGGMAMFIAPMIEQMIGKVDGAGWTIALDTASAMVEQTWFIYMPTGKAGLTSLIGEESTRPRVPGFVSPETINYFTLNIDTDAIGPFVSNLMKNPMIAGQLDPQAAEDVQRRIREIFATMGNEVHIATHVVQPLTAKSQRTVFAMECEKPQEFENLIAKEAPQVGLERREFLGQGIYTIDPMGTGVPEDTFSLGIGGGFVIAGPSPDVELALRASGEANAETLENHANFQRAMQAPGSSKGVGWAYADVVETIVTGMRIQILSMRAQAEEMREWGPEFADEMLKQADEMEKQFAELPSAEVLRRYLGPTSSYFQSIEQGFVGKSYILPAVEE